MNKQEFQPWEILLIILGFPVWFPLAVAAAAIVFALYISMWAVMISLWAVFGSVVGCSVGGVLAGIVFVFGENVLTGWAVMGAGILCMGLSVFFFHGCKAATRGLLWMTKKSAGWLKRCFVKKEETA